MSIYVVVYKTQFHVERKRMQIDLSQYFDFAQIFFSYFFLLKCRAYTEVSVRNAHTEMKTHIFMCSIYYIICYIYTTWNWDTLNLSRPFRRLQRMRTHASKQKKKCKRQLLYTTRCVYRHVILANGFFFSEHKTHIDMTPTSVVFVRHKQIGERM